MTLVFKYIFVTTLSTLPFLKDVDQTELQFTPRIELDQETLGDQEMLGDQEVTQALEGCSADACG